MSKYLDPQGRRHGGVPTYPWGLGPQHLRTFRQLRAEGKRPGGEWEAQVLRGRRGRDPLTAYLYDAEKAKPKREPTAAQLEALQIARWIRSSNAAERRGIDTSEMREVIDRARQSLASRRAERGRPEVERGGRERTR
ncbi:RRQRL motif-containing zinc-binding protein [Nocardia carnea]|uniref:RRQRL motif-containing zinc-binding protein n=1 Tax=Nocardia carnea TaxID=37328 RepID=UPI0024588D3F|nr:RRQRL motif-containing zinc-binding protein [Nocardia carnea]